MKINSGLSFHQKVAVCSRGSLSRLLSYAGCCSDIQRFLPTETPALRRSATTIILLWRLLAFRPDVSSGDMGFGKG
jgi:hypothetical protein